MTFVKMHYIAPDSCLEDLEVLSVLCESGNASVEDYTVIDFQWGDNS